MVRDDKQGGPYSYTYRSSGSQEDAGATREMQETLVTIKDTLMLLTGGCEITERAGGSFCEKHGRPVPPGAKGCDYLATHFASRDSEGRSKAQLQQYVNEVLGIKNPDSVRRLTGT